LTTPHAAQRVAPRAADSCEAEALHRLVLQSLDDDQAVETVSIPLAGKSSIADHMVIASGRSTRQVAAMAQKIAERLKKEGHGNARIEGLPAADWVLIDAGDVVVHLFRPEVRSFYNLERRWGFGDEGSATSMAGRA
jgi:ribosome-associated protein